MLKNILGTKFFRDHMRSYNPNNFLYDVSCSGFFNSEFSKSLAPLWKENRIIVPITTHGDSMIHSKHSVKGGEYHMAPVFCQYLNLPPSLQTRTCHASFLIPGPNSVNAGLYYEPLVRELNELHSEPFHFKDPDTKEDLEIWVICVATIGDGKWVPILTGYTQQPSIFPTHAWKVVGRKVSKKEDPKKKETYPYYDDIWRLLPFSHWLRSFISESKKSAAEKKIVLTLGPYEVVDDHEIISKFGAQSERATAANVQRKKHPAYLYTGYLYRGVFTRLFPSFNIAKQALHDPAHVVRGYLLSTLFYLSFSIDS